MAQYITDRFTHGDNIYRLKDTISGYATQTYVDNLISANDAMVYKGTISGGATSPGTYTPAAEAGWTYRVSTAGYINGVRVEVGDILICNTDNTAAATSSTYSSVSGKWNIIQNNVDGALFKSTNTFTDGKVLISDGTAGKVKDSGFTIGKSVPADAKFTDTTYSAGTGLELDGTEFSLADVTKSNTTSTASPAFGGTVTVIDSVSSNDSGQVTGINIKTVTLPSLGTTAATAAAGNHTHDIGLATSTGTSAITLNSNAKYQLTAGGKSIIFTTPNAAAANHTHTTALASDTGTSTITLASGGKYKLTAGGTSVIFTMPTSTNYSHPTYTAAEAAAIKVGRDATGHVVLGSALIPSDIGAAADDHTHTLTLAADTGTSQLTLSSGGKYKLTAGGSSYIFTMPEIVDTKVTQTATTTDANYEILFSATADNTTRTEAARKASGLTFNPSTGVLTATALNTTFTHKLTIGTLVYDGSEDISIPVYGGAISSV